VSDATTPAEFDPIFRQGVPIIGGHAVNLWATYYSARGDRELREFEPFISKDGDIYLKDPEMAQAVATAAGWRFDRNPEPRSAVLGRIVLERGSVQLFVHVMRSVTGLTEADLCRTETLVLKGGATYRVPAPEIMLKAKLENLATIAQADRQDERHVRILVPCLRHYLTDTVLAVRSGHVPEREAVDRFMEALRVTTSPTARRLDLDHRLNLPAALPARVSLGELSPLPRILAVYEHQIEGPKQRQRL